jgi:cyanate permease
MAAKPRRAPGEAITSRAAALMPLPTVRSGAGGAGASPDAGGSLAGAVLVLLWSRVESQFGFILIWIGLGLAMSSTLYEPAFATVTRWFPRDRGKPLLAITICAGFASTIFLPLTTRLVSDMGWRDAVQALAIMVLVFAALPHLIFLRKPPDPPPEKLTHDGLVESPGTTLHEALRKPVFWWMTGGFAMQWFAATSVAVFMIAYLTERGGSAGFAAAATGAIGAAQVVSRIFTTIFGRRFSQPALAAMMFALQTLSVAILILWQAPGGVLLAVLLLGGGRGALTLIRPILLADAFGLRNYAAISGTQNAIMVTANAIAPVSVGLAYGLLDSYEPIMWFMAACSAIAAVTMIPVTRIVAAR